MVNCRRCGEEIEDRFRYCPSCGTAQRAKIVESFPAHPGLPGDSGRALRVSRYLNAADFGDHTRFSIWNPDGVADAAISLTEAESGRLARFLAGPEDVRGETPTDLIGRARRFAGRLAHPES